jgi:hypothetical protein
MLIVFIKLSLMESLKIQIHVLLNILHLRQILSSRFINITQNLQHLKLNTMDKIARFLFVTGKNNAQLVFSIVGTIAGKMKILYQHVELKILRLNFIFL